MHYLQKNMRYETGHLHYEPFFVRNEFVTSGIQNNLNYTVWTVALVYGFFKQIVQFLSILYQLFIVIRLHSKSFFPFPFFTSNAYDNHLIWRRNDNSWLSNNNDRINGGKRREDLNWRFDLGLRLASIGTVPFIYFRDICYVV